MTCMKHFGSRHLMQWDLLTTSNIIESFSFETFILEDEIKVQVNLIFTVNQLYENYARFIEISSWQYFSLQTSPFMFLFLHKLSCNYSQHEPLFQ